MVEIGGDKEIFGQPYRYDLVTSEQVVVVVHGDFVTGHTAAFGELIFGFPGRTSLGANMYRVGTAIAIGGPPGKALNLSTFTRLPSPLRSDCRCRY